VGKYHTGKDTQGRPLGFKTHIKPARQKVVLHRRRLAEVIRAHRGAPQEALIRHLNPIIRGWSNYYRTAVSTRTFDKADDVLYHCLRGWASRRHPDKGQGWIVRRYWRLPAWTFGTPDGRHLLRKHGWTRIVRHIKVRGDKSPFDGDWAYWSGRMGRYPGITCWLAMLLKRQKGRCAHCGLYFRPGDLLEVHHRDGEHSNNREGTLAALHRHCHDAVHGQGSIKPGGCVRDKDCSSEEPYECESLTSGSEDQPGG
jgi:RNA-directed DNA polymerase